MRIEMTSSFIAINIVDLNHAQGEGNVDNDENEKEHHDVKDHVGHANDYGSSLSPHQTDLNRTQKSQKRGKTPDGASNKSNFVSFIRTIAATLVVVIRHASQDKRH